MGVSFYCNTPLKGRPMNSDFVNHLIKQQSKVPQSETDFLNEEVLQLSNDNPNRIAQINRIDQTERGDEYGCVAKTI